MEEKTALHGRVTQAQAQSAFPGETRRIRLGVWGLGRGMHVVRTAQLCNIDVVAGCDFNAHFQKAFEDAVPQGRFTADAQEFLSWEMDAVLVATFCPNHGPDSIRVLESGKHVLAEVTAFHTPAEGVALVEAVEGSGKVYQLAENYPYTPQNRYFKSLWQAGVLGELQYGEYSYLHDCLQYTYVYIDGTPIQPGWTVHRWRSWLPWHYYCTHTLGPVMEITGRRPVRVTALPGKVNLPGHLPLPNGLKGVAPSLVEMDNGALVRNLMGGCTNDDNLQVLCGTKGACEWVHGKVALRLGGRGNSPMHEVEPPEDPLDALAASTGHGGGDFWTLYHFANEIFNGVKPPFDVYRAADVTLPGIQAFRSSLAGGEAQAVPDFRDPQQRAAYREDDFAPERYDTKAGVFPGSVERAAAGEFTTLVKELIETGDRWQAFAAWSERAGDVVAPESLMPLEAAFAERLETLPATAAQAQELIEAAPESDGARVLRELLGRFEPDLLEAGRAQGCVERTRALMEAGLRQRALSLSRPQLQMERVGLEGLPEVSLPEGYTLRHAGPGDSDAAVWCTIIGEAFGGPRYHPEWKREMIDRGDANTDHILFVCEPGGRPVGTASAYGNNHNGYVHYVGVLPDQAGKGLGFQASLAVLHLFARRGCERAWLVTDDFRRPALRTYWKLGFKPKLTHWSHQYRWQALAESLGIAAFAQP